jgi:peptidoglycan/LPS O-acetylase OafA/YrhL
MIGPAPPKDVGVIHFWSLAVEEHFYLVWPFLVWLLTPRGLVRACGALIAFAFALRWGLVATHHEPMDVYGFTPARIDTIAWGALLALMAEARGITPRMAQAARRALPIALLALVPIALHDRGLNPWSLWTQRFGLDAIAVAATSLVVIAVTTPRGSRLRGVLVSRPMRAFGRYSYGMYIYHLPILTFVLLPLGIDEALRVKLGYFPGVIVFCVVTTTLCAGLAIASFELFETRFLRLKGLVSYGARRGIESTTVSQGISR